MSTSLSTISPSLIFTSSSSSVMSVSSISRPMPLAALVCDFMSSERENCSVWFMPVDSYIMSLSISVVFC